MFVSPGIMHNETTIRKSNWVGIHLAIVDRPAFTVKSALIKGTCEGDLKLCYAQLSTAAKDNYKGFKPALSYQDQEELDNILLTYYNNINKIKKHNNIILLNETKPVTTSNMVENTNDSINDNQGNETNEVKNPTQITQKTDYDLNMCVAQFIERGLDSNTAREICVTALGTQGDMMGGGGGQFGGGGGNPAQQGNPQQQRGQGGYSDKFYNTIANLLNTKNTTIHTLQSKVDNYERKFQEKIGFTLDENGMKQIEEWKQKEEENRKNALKQGYVEFLKLYNNNEEQITIEADEYIKNNLPLESVKNIYSKRTTIEESQKAETKTTTTTKTTGK
jgi:hypothetical protein